MSTTTLEPGETAYRQFGPLHIRIDRHHEGVSINVTNQPALDRSFTNLDEGRDYLRLLRDEANAGTAVWAIEQLAGAWTSAAAIVDAAEQDMVTGINANIDAAQRTPVDVSDILAERGPTFSNLKRNVVRDFSRTRVSTKPPTAAELGRIRAARRNDDGTLTVTRAPGQPWTVLKALRDRLGGEPTYKAGTARVIDSLTFPAEQLAGYREERAA